MSKAYYYVKKRRELKRERIPPSSNDDSQCDTSDEAAPPKTRRLSPDIVVTPQHQQPMSPDIAAVSENQHPPPDSGDHPVELDISSEHSFSDPVMFDDPGTDVAINSDYLHNYHDDSTKTIDSVDSEYDSSLIDQSESTSATISLKDKLRTWALKNIGTLKNTVVSELLCILRSEGYVTFPKTAAALLKTQSCNFTVRPMLSNRKTTGSYTYFGIQYCMENRIAPAIYKEDHIRVLVNTDGLPLYENSHQQFWPIMIQIYNKKYTCRPMIVALYHGDSKPDSADDFLNDFVQESNKLIAEGLIIDDKKYAFEIAAFVCDTPARAFIKCCKSHTGFYSCVRCEIKGITVESHRVYCETDCVRRTGESFKNKRQKQHHLDNCTSPLTRIMNFDPVSQVVLDELHLLHFGAMKAVLEKWLKGKKVLPWRQRKLLQELLETVSASIPKEFQRKKLDLKDRSNWKATQYRFFLLYCGPIILYHVLPEDKYRHFLLLSTACRILSSEELAVRYSEYAGKLLLKYFNLMPTIYGPGSQVMNCHNLIHLADDVKRMQAPLSHYSAYPFENGLGFVKRLIRTPHKPLVQVARRLAELEAGRDMVVRPHPLISGCVPKRNIDMDKAKIWNRNYFQQIDVKGVTIGVKKPDNIVRLMNGDIVKVRAIFCIDKNARIKKKDIKLRGLVMKNKGDVFTYPCASSFVGIEQVKLPSRKRKTTFSVRDIKSKCILLEVGNKVCSIALLHTSN